MTAHRPLIVGTRGSALALKQTEEVLARLRATHPSHSFRIVKIRTAGDRNRRDPLQDMARGVFVKELELALLDRKIDLAVHSLKDMPSETPSGLVIAAVAGREDPRDVLVSRGGEKLDQLPRGARVGTSSPRRAAQLLAARPDLELGNIRGNVPTRLERVARGEFQATVLAAAGLLRLGLEERVTEYLDPTVFIPAPGQGALAIEVRADDTTALEVAAAAADPAATVTAMAERSFEAWLGGGCTVPIAAYAQPVEVGLRMYGMVASQDGRRTYRTYIEGTVEGSAHLGEVLGEKLVQMGAGELLRAGVP